MKKLLSIKNIIVSLVLLLGIWQLMYVITDFSSALFPSPLQAFSALAEMISNGLLFSHIGASMYRFTAGYISSVIIAVLLGLVLGRLPKVFQYINPAVQLLRPISPMAWMPFIVLWFGIGDIPAIIIIFISAFFPVLLSTVSAVNGIDPIYMKVSENFGIKQPQIMWKVIFPAVFPQVANSIHLALGTAWVFLVAGEMTGTQSGLGYLVIDARNNLRADILFADIIVIGLIGLILDGLLKTAEKHILKVWGGAD